MPPRKSNVSAVSAEETPKPSKKQEDDGLNVEDLNLPKSIVQRLAKGVLPPNTQIQKDALLAMSKGATVFVNYLTSTAAENAARHGKKTVMPNDVFDALKELEFENMLPRVEAEVLKFTSILADKRNTYRKKVREEKKAAKDKVPNGHGEDESPPAKKARRSSAGSDEDDENVDETVEGADQDDDEVEDDEVEEDAPEEGLAEDPLEEKENEPSDDEMGDGDESD
ncbi:hypothetical protein N0V90_006825 [Kalmusia sp. IMI 367209]|nr:hypothetical protein N0V90_006825 [Kalmusia sp. IMI 367209]